MAQIAKRCAIYTRKSFQPPTGQEITSLESQRAICSSYVISQQHRGWVEIVKHYDDPGRTGADVSRPALQQMLSDVEAGLIDVVLVYKLDRLTRTLFDFVRLMDFLERHNVALVSITQNFDTADSLGRLVLNVLLTFAQFEREILSDRMRDKVRVMKEMGRWVSGAPPLGYNIVRKKLIPNPREAAAVRMIFQTYLKTESYAAVHSRLEEQAFRRKVWRAKTTGRVYGGGRITLSSLYHILRNPIYNGQVSHLGRVYPGIHEPIVEAEVFDEVQAVMARRRSERPRAPHNLLTGLLFDAAGRPMCVQAHEYKGRQLRYYISNVSAWARRRKLRRMRSNADGLEQLVVASLKSLLRDREQLRLLLLEHGVHGPELDGLTKAGSACARRFDDLSPARTSDVLHGLLERVELSTSAVTIILWKEELRRFLLWDSIGIFGIDAGARQRNGSVHFLRVAASVLRTHRLFALPVIAQPSEAEAKRNPKLISLLDDAAKAHGLMLSRRDLDVPGLATRFGCEMDRYSRLVRLNYLAPDIQLAIRDGSQPADLTRRELLRVDLPLDWATQRTLLGFASQPEHFRNPNARSSQDLPAPQ